MIEHKNSRRQPKQRQNKPLQGNINSKTKAKANPKAMTQAKSQGKAKQKEKNPFEGVLKPKAKIQPRYSRVKDAQKYKQNKQNNKAKHSNGAKAENLKIIPLGGLNEIGKNFTVLEYKDQILIIDCGNSFPEEGMYGIDVVIPDFSYLDKNAKKIVGLVITHGHEDHIGAVPYFVRKFNVPIYGTRLSLGLIRNKLEEHGLTANLNTVKAGTKFKVGEFKIEPIRTTHSIADAIALYIQTPAANLFHTGDFKIDYTPIDEEPIDLVKFAEIGKRGVDIMLADSTNALRPGFTASEQVVGSTLDRIFSQVENRIIIASFSSNVHRVQKIIELAAKYGRKCAISGRSMENVVKLAQELGYMKVPAGMMVELNKTKNIPDRELVIITTGSQGEPMSALARMANDEHRNVHLKKGDTVILSSSPVPGNEKAVSTVVNKLFEKGVNVIYNDIADIHVSGHACQEELKLIQTLIKPKFFMPVHGEYRHLVQHAAIAESIGMSRDRIFILSNGDQLTVDKKSATKFQNVCSAEDILVDGLGIGDVGNIVLRDRKQLSESGLIIIVFALDKASGTIVSGPDIVSRGFVYVREHEDLINRAKALATTTIEACLDNNNTDWNTIKNSVRDEMRKFIFNETKRSPIILPIILDV